MAKLTTIVHVSQPNYDGQEAVGENGISLSHITNFSENQLEMYKQLIRSFNSHVVFGITDDTWGFYEDEGVAFKTSGYALYISNSKTLRAFHNHAKKMKHVHKHRPGYVKSYVSYYIKKLKPVRTNAQKRKYRQIKS